MRGRNPAPWIALRAAMSLPVLGLLGAPGTLGAQTPDPAPLIDDAQPRVSVSLSPSELTVGDRVTAVLTVSAPETRLAGSPRFPDWDATWGTAEIVEVGPPETLEPRGGVATFRQRLVLTAFRPGEVELPPREVEVPLARGPVRIATAAALGFEISPVLPPSAAEDRGGGVERGVGPGIGTQTGEEPELEPRSEEPLRTLPVSRAFWLTAGTLGAACLVLGLLLRRRVRPSEAGAEDLGPLLRLERDLAGLPKTPSLVEAHALLSRALRLYLGRELGFPAPESTTAEIGRELAARRVPEGVHRDAAEVLAACDLVKFARRATTPGVLDRRIGTVRRMGRELEEYLHPPQHPPQDPSQPPEPAEGGVP